MTSISVGNGRFNASFAAKLQWQPPREGTAIGANPIILETDVGQAGFVSLLGVFRMGAYTVGGAVRGFYMTLLGTQ